MLISLHKYSADVVSKAADEKAAAPPPSSAGLGAILSTPAVDSSVPPWVLLAMTLPTEGRPSAKKKRSALFERFDCNKNQFLSLAEVDKGLTEEFKLREGDPHATKHCKPAILRAFQAAKDETGSEYKSTSGVLDPDDYVTRSEFRLLLVCIQHYFELFAIFKRIDTGVDQKINVCEFKRAIPALRKWGVVVRNPEAQFKKIDVNGGGELLYDEFSLWALKRGLELIDDDPEDGEEEEIEKLVEAHKMSADEASLAAKKLVERQQRLSQPVVPTIANQLGGLPDFVSLAKRLPMGHALGTKWKVVWPKPSKGRELVNEELAAALSADRVEFTKHEIQALELEDVKVDSFIGVGNEWYEQAGGERDKLERKRLFDQFDFNNNGYLSLAEVDKGLTQRFKLEGNEHATKFCKPAILRAFNAAKDASGNTEGLHKDFVTLREFRLLLVALERYFELWAAFDVIDQSEDRRISFEEFEVALPTLRSWGVTIRRDPRKVFDEIDRNRGSVVLFDEFSGWALRRGLELVDDDPEEVCRPMARTCGSLIAPSPASSAMCSACADDR